MTDAERRMKHAPHTGEFRLEDLAQAVGCSPEDLFDPSSADQAIVALFPEPPAASVEVLSDGGPTGNLIDDIMHLSAEMFATHNQPIEVLQTLHDLFQSNPSLEINYLRQAERTMQQFIDYVTPREGVDVHTASTALRLCLAIVQQAADECIEDPTLGPVHEHMGQVLRRTRELLGPPHHESEPTTP